MCKTTFRRQRALRLMRLEDRIVPNTYTVTNNADSGAGSLRQAIINANGHAGADSINFLVIPSPITLTTGEIAINDALTIGGPGSGLLTVSGNNLNRIFNTTGAVAGSLISISGLTLTGGSEPVAGADGGAILADNEILSLNDCVITGNSARDQGGGIKTNNSLTLTNCIVSNNSVTVGFGEGGGIWHGSGNLIVDDSKIAGNSAPDLGGGIFSKGDVTLTGCTVSNNAATTSFGDGGGIWHATGKLTIGYSTVTGNTANFYGGGIRVYQAESFSLYNSTISGNTATNAAGGGISITTIQNAVILNSTISGNAAPTDDGGGIEIFGHSLFTVRNSTVAFNSAGGSGGGIAVGSPGLAMVSSIVAKNTGAILKAPDISGLVSTSFGFIGSTFGATVVGSPLTGNPLLGALDFNGGPTKTHPLLTGSPCLNTGLAGGSVTDQRGAGFIREYDGPADIGAFEEQHTFFVHNTNDSGSQSLRQAVIDSNANPGADVIVFNLSLNGDTITLTTGEIAISDAVTMRIFSSPETAFVTVDGNAADRIFNLSSAPAGSQIEIHHLIFNGGYASSYGGAIRGDNQQLTLDNCVFTDNSTTANGGGAVAMTTGGSVTASYCVFSNNTAAAFAGAIDVFGTGAKTVLLNCVVSGNTATDAGGVYARTYLFAEGCTFSGNKATAGSGGAVYMSGNGGTGNMFLRNCTISGNQSTANGGGILLFSFPGTLTVQNSTIVENAALFTNGGGIALVSGLGVISVESSIVSGNSSAGADDIFSGGTVNVRTSAIGSGPGFTKTDLGGNLPFQPHANLALGALANNGGPTQTHLPGKGSPLISAGSNPANLTTDQRGPGFVRVASAVEIGAVEVQHNFVVLNANESGTGSLRQAVLDANANPGADMVTFDPTFFSISRSISLFDALDGASQISISEAVTITGPGAALATVSGHNDTRIFNTQSTPAGSKIVISGLTLTEGKAAGYGGAILGSDEALILTGCVLTGNTTTVNGGGAVAITSGGSLTATDCVFSSNTGASAAGAIDVIGAGAKTVLQRCTVSGNMSTFAGGIYARNYLLAEATTFSGNNATGGKGGAVYMSGYGGSGTMIVRNCTISGNSSTANGGGIALVNFSGALTVQNSTITNNAATALLTNGGGISRVSGAGSISLESSIVSGNTSLSGPDIFSGGSVQVKTSAIGSGSGFTKTDLGGNLPFQAHANLKLGALASNGGPTQTHKPQIDSPLIEKGSNPIPLATDQRGVTRVFGATIDIGSVEYFDQLVVTNDKDAGLGSLRQNLIDANISAGLDTISFEPVFFGTPRTITLTTAELTISDSINIIGPGAALATVSGNNVFHVFDIHAPVLLNATLSGLTITKGDAEFGGGGIAATNTNLTVQDCIITGNSAGGFGGLFVDAQGTLNLVNCQVTNNTAEVTGGVAAFCPATIVRSVISGNTATLSSGGGLFSYNQLSLVDSLIAGNSAATGGGGIVIRGNGPVTILNSTISGNTSGTNAGGVQMGSYAFAPFNGTLTIQNSTITDNKAAGGLGGGVARMFGTGNIVLESTIISGNTAAAGGPDIHTSGTVNAKTSLIGTISGITTFTPDAFTNANVGNSPMLGPLANNGGLTMTHALAPNSPAINNGSNLLMLANDQRGPGFSRFFAAGPDIGAYELQLNPCKVLSVQVNDGSPQRSRVTSLLVTFDQSPNLPINPADGFQLKRQSDNAVVSLSALPMGNTVTITFTGGPVDFGSLADGRYTLTVLATQILNLDGDGNGIMGDNFIQASALFPSPPTNIFRLFGDADGNGLVDGTDFGAFRNAFNTNSSVFDFDGSGVVDGLDFGQFRARFGVTI